jgi:hypothetical protein
LKGFFIGALEHSITKGGDQLKRGVIIYTVGEAPASWTEDREKLMKSSVFGAEAVEIITTRTGHFDVLDAWWSLKSKGMNYIECKLAMFTEDGELNDTGRILRLCG